jgi:hypothetical protein
MTPSLFVIQCQFQYNKCGLMIVSVGHTNQKFSAIRIVHALPWFIDQLFDNLYLGELLSNYTTSLKMVGTDLSNKVNPGWSNV